MTNSLQDLLRQDADRVEIPTLDAGDVIAQGEQRLHRRRITAVLASIAAVAVIAVGGIVAGSVQHRSEGPVDKPNKDKTSVPVTRKILYSDVDYAAPGDSVRFGDRVVQTGNDFVHLDVTDDGFLYTDRGGVWFSDGGTPQQIGSRLCAASRNGAFSHFDNRAVVTANSGSTAAWFDCTHPATPTLVVYDTSSGHEVARRPVAFCGEEELCELVDVTSDYVYFNRGVYVAYPRPNYKFDLRTAKLSPSSTQEHAEDLRSHPRGLVIGDSWQTGRPTDAIGQGLWVDGSRLVVLNEKPGAEPVPAAAFDTLTRQPVRLVLPRGYHHELGPIEGPGDFSLFEWLDDDTVALVGGTGEILSCQLSTGRCVVTVRGPRAGEVRVVPNGPLPG